MDTRHFIEDLLSMRLRRKVERSPVEPGASFHWKADWGLEEDPRLISRPEGYGAVSRSRATSVADHDLVAMTERLMASGERVPRDRSSQSYPLRSLYRDEVEPFNPRGSIVWDYIETRTGMIAAKGIETWSNIEGSQRRQRLERDVDEMGVVQGEKLMIDGVLSKEQHHQYDDNGNVRLVIEQHYSEDGKPVAIVDMFPDPKRRGMWLARTTLHPKSDAEEVSERSVNLSGLPRLSIDGPGRIIEDLHLEPVSVRVKMPVLND